MLTNPQNKPIGQWLDDVGLDLLKILNQLPHMPLEIIERLEAHGRELRAAAYQIKRKEPR